MKVFRFNKIKWDKILSAALVIVILVGCTAGLAAIFNTKTTSVSDFKFKKGALNSQGLYVKSDTSIYTKDLIECEGLEITPDFEATGTYQVYYYGSDKKFIKSTEVFDAHLDGAYKRGSDAPEAKYCRIVISPDTPEDDDGYPKENWKIRIWEVADYANDYDIIVNKKQSNFTVPYEGSNQLVYRSNSTASLMDGVNGFSISSAEEGKGLNMSEVISTTGKSNICFVVDADKLDKITVNYLAQSKCIESVKLGDLDGDVVKRNGIVYITVNVPANCVGIVLNSVTLDVDFSDAGVYVW